MSEDWDKSLEGYEDLILVQAHCDMRILHRPGHCVYCDLYPEAQLKRLELGVNFTGENDESFLPCPAEKARGAENLYGWGGNQPRGPGVPVREKVRLKQIERPSSRAIYGDMDLPTWQEYRREFSESPQDEDRPGDASG